jgi:hypothetical protein
MILNTVTLLGPGPYVGSLSKVLGLLRVLGATVRVLFAFGAQTLLGGPYRRDTTNMVHRLLCRTRWLQSRIINVY